METKTKSRWSSRDERLRLEIINLLGNKCRHCGFADMRALQIDHVNGGGSKQHGKLGRTSFYYLVRNELREGQFDNFQLLCANCNWIKRAENKEVGCKPKRTRWRAENVLSTSVSRTNEG